MTSDEKRLARHRKYNASAKGRARYQRYEQAHPERATRWSPIMIMRGRKNGKWEA